MTPFASIADLLSSQVIELPSWAFGNSGTRFKVFGTPGTPRTVREKLADAAKVNELRGVSPRVGAARTVREKLADAAKVNELTGLSPKVALHIPWDRVEDYGALKSFAAD